MTEIINKVASSGLITFNLEDYYVRRERVELDIKDWLYEGLMLREKDFRETLKNYNWSLFENKFVAVFCSADAVVPTWAFMLISIYLHPFAKKIVFGNLIDLEKSLFDDALNKIDFSQFKDERIVIKGCSKIKVPESVYVDVTTRLMPYAKSIMFGEPCSTVPVYKRR
ncbi:MAG: DUF2480 family protein [Bacteroidia bacterium]